MPREKIPSTPSPFTASGTGWTSCALLPILPNVKLGDIATIDWEHQTRFSGYLGNGKPAIAVAIQRAPGGSLLDTSKAGRSEIEKLKARYRNIDFQLTDTQRILIETANTNMLEALRDAIIFTLLVILLFLGNFRAIIAALASIPMVFFATIAIRWLTGGDLNIVVYTAIILALGMLVDDAVVVLENIERHLKEMKEGLEKAIVHGTREVVGPVFAGTVATIAIMFPFLFVGDFPAANLPATDLHPDHRPPGLLFSLHHLYSLPLLLPVSQGAQEDTAGSMAGKTLRKQLRPPDYPLCLDPAFFQRR